ncbi:MAG: hypothetical protein NTW72_11410 [Gemmatimonadetes bacterium]|nr:hypothetical protein [Gemmatimonadota bacterium]
MADKPLDEDRLRELIGDAPLANADGDAVHELAAPGRSPKSVDALAAAVLAAMEAERGPRRKYSTNERPPAVVIRRRRSSYFLLALVLAIAGFVGSRGLRRTPPVPSDPVDLVSVLSPAAVAGPALAPEWSVERGVSDSLSERGRATRVGALLVEFERASVRNDSSASALGDAIAALLADQPDGAEVGALFAGGPAEARLPRARHALAPLVRAAPMGIGGWLQAGRVAAAAGDAGFFASTRSKESLSRLLDVRGVTPDTQAARDRLDTLLHRRGRPNFAAVSDALDLLQRELAN